MSFPFYEAGILEQVFSIWYLAMCGDRSLNMNRLDMNMMPWKNHEYAKASTKYQVLNTRYRR